MCAGSAGKSDDGKVIADSGTVGFDNFKARYIIGNPDLAIEKIKEYERELKPSEMICWMHMPGIRGKHAQASVELFAKEVMPAFR